MEKKNKISLVIITILLVLFICCACSFLLVVITNSSSRNVSTSSLKKGAVDQTVAIIDVDGEISSNGSSDLFGNYKEDMVSVIIKKLERAKNDGNVKAVLLRVNSPGGEVYASQKIYNKILEVKKADKKVVVLMEDLAASGGYYVSAPADWIVASEVTITGSIGVRFSTFDYSGLYDKVGIKELHVANSKGKLKVLNHLEDPTSEGYKVLQSVADDTYDKFVEVVASGRKMTTEEVVNIADGRIYSGKKAFEIGLVDQLGEQQVAMEKVAKLAELENPNFVVYENSSGSLSTIGSYGVSILNLVSPGKSITDASQDGLKIYYLPYL